MANAAIKSEAFAYVDWVSSNDNFRPKTTCNGRGVVRAIIGDHHHPISIPKLRLYTGDCVAQHCFFIVRWNEHSNAASRIGACRRRKSSVGQRYGRDRFEDKHGDRHRRQQTPAQHDEVQGANYHFGKLLDRKGIEGQSVCNSTVVKRYTWKYVIGC
jgi:hypothetical protein